MPVKRARRLIRDRGQARRIGGECRRKSPVRPARSASVPIVARPSLRRSPRTSVGQCSPYSSATTPSARAYLGADRSRRRVQVGAAGTRAEPPRHDYRCALLAPSSSSAWLVIVGFRGHATIAPRCVRAKVGVTGTMVGGGVDRCPACRLRSCYHSTVDAVRGSEQVSPLDRRPGSWSRCSRFGICLRREARERRQREARKAAIAYDRESLDILQSRHRRRRW
jgi:hypothetical protein